MFSVIPCRRKISTHYARRKCLLTEHIESLINVIRTHTWKSLKSGVKALCIYQSNCVVEAKVKFGPACSE